MAVIKQCPGRCQVSRTWGLFLPRQNMKEALPPTPARRFGPHDPETPRAGGLFLSTALNTARTGSISAFQLSQQFGSFGLGSGFSHDFAPLHRLTLAFGHACRTIR